MSNFLQLCQAVRQEAGISGTGPSSVLNQQGEMKRVVDWVARAYRDVQNLHRNWDFLRSDFTFPTIVGNQEYTPAAANLPEHQSWKTDSFRIFENARGWDDEVWLRYYPWEDFRDIYIRSGNRDATGRPLAWTIRPTDQAVVLWPLPDTDYTIVGEYFKRAQVMTANTDVPIFPVEFHDVLMWRALMFYAGFENAAPEYAVAKGEYGDTLSKLRRDQLPSITVGGSIV